MAESVKVIDPDMGSGYDYDSLYDWEAAQQADIDASGTIAVAKCRCTAGTADTTPIVIDGWTTSAADYIKIWTDTAESYRHNGTYETGNHYRLIPTTGTSIIENREPNVKILGLQFRLAINTATQIAIGLYAQVTVSECIFVDTYTGSTYAHIAFNTNANSASSIFVINSIFCDFLSTQATSGAIHSDESSYSFYVYNCTFSNCAVGYRRDSATVTIKNCVFSGCTTDASGTITDTYCATTNDNTKGLTALGTGNRFSQTFTFVGAADFHLASNDAGALGYGLNLYNDANYPFQTDIDGQDRGGAAAAWDIGADEYVAAAGASIVPILLKQYRARRD